MASPGTLIEYLQQKRITCALCLREDTRGNLFVRTEDNREDKVNPSKVLFRASAALAPDMAPEAMVQALRLAAEERDRVASDIDLGELWELLIEEGDQAYQLEDLAELYFGEQPGTVELSGFFRALSNDNTYFQRKGSEYRVRPRDQVEEILTRVRVEEERAREREEIARWLKLLWETPGTLAPAGFEEAATRYLTWIRDVAVHGLEASRFKDVNRLLKDVGITRKDAPFHLMVRSGEWTADENLLLHRFRTPIAFSDELEAEAREAAQRMEAILGQEHRVDLTHLDAFTVDDETTTEIDDALSLEETGEGYRVFIHIADASAFVEPGTPLDREAAVRGTAIYLPDGKIRMLPEVLGDGACSLLAGVERPAFTFVLELDRECNLLSAAMHLSRIKVRRRLTYQQGDQELADSPLLAIAEAFRARRREQGAVTVPFPRTNVRVEADGTITVEREVPEAPGQIVVSEMMIQANRLAGEYLAEHRLPALFRGQGAPDKPIPPETEFKPEVLFKLRKLFRRGEASLEPTRHAGLGLDAYAQASSPIRRYADLLTQRQLKHHLAQGSALYAREELEAFSAHLGQSVSQADQMEKDRKAYWTLRHLEERRFQELDAVVLANLPDKHLVQLVDVLWETDCPRLPGRPLPPGSRLKVRIELVWPRDGVVRVSPVVEEE